MQVVRLTRWWRMACIVVAIFGLYSFADDAPLSDNVIHKDLYAVLGVQPDATVQDIKKAFRKLAQQYHPDKRLGNVHDQTSTFQEISEAYDILSDRARRDEYDSRRFVAEHQMYDTSGYDYHYYDPPDFAEAYVYEDFAPGGSARTKFHSVDNAVEAGLAGPMLHMGQVSNNVFGCRQRTRASPVIILPGCFVLRAHPSNYLHRHLFVYAGNVSLRRDFVNTGLHRVRVTGRRLLVGGVPRRRKTLCSKCHTR
jgi:hypothetical protein